MLRKLSEPREDLLDLLVSPVGQMVARRIDAAYGFEGQQIPSYFVDASARMLAAVQAMSREQLESCAHPLNRFFLAVPFTLAIPVVIEIEKKWPHHIDTILEANKRLDLIRKGGEYSVMFSNDKIENVFKAVSEIAELQ